MKQKFLVQRNRSSILRSGSATLLAAAVAGTGSAALAQQTVAQQEPVAPGFYYGAELGATHDSNVFRVSGANGPVSDWAYSYGLIGGYDRTFSRTHLFGDAAIRRVDYDKLDRLDFTEQDLHGGVSTNFPGDVNAGLALAHGTELAKFADINSTGPDANSTRRNVITRNNATLTADAPIAIDWRAVVGGGPTRYRNSNDIDKPGDLNTNEVNGGVRYQSALGNRVDFLVRHLNADYKGPEPVTQSNYKENGAEVRAVWTLSGASRIDGRVGFVKRKNDTRPDLNFTGPAYDFTYTWTPTVLTTVALYALRERGAAGDAFLQTATTTTYRLTPSLAVGYRVTLRALIEYTTRNYYGDQITLANNRKDTQHAIGVGGGWTPERWLQLNLELRHEDRGSPLADLEYKANVARLVGVARF